MTELPRELEVAISGFENALANYWSKDADERVSDRRLTELFDVVRQKREALTEAINAHVRGEP